jgi:hypothetical protein
MADSSLSKQDGPVRLYDKHGDGGLAASYHECLAVGTGFRPGALLVLRLGWTNQGMANQHKVGQRADSTRHRRDIARHATNRGKVDIPNQLAVQ